MTTLLIPTAHELRQLEAGTLPAFLRPMEPQPPDGTDSLRDDGMGGWQAYAADGEPVTNGVEGWATDALVYPGTVIVWGEKWVRGGYSGLPFHEEPASTMLVELARHRSTVVECRPVKVSELTDRDVRRLGYQQHIGVDPARDYSNKILVREAIHFLVDDWQTNNPTIPFDSWAWWVELKGKTDVPEND